MLKYFTLFILIAEINGTVKWKTVYQKISHEDDFSEFFKTMKSDRNIVSPLQYNALTVFVPLNKAIQNYRGTFNPRYHITYQLLDLNQLTTISSFNTSEFNGPPIWITRTKQDIFLNNAKLLVERSNFVAKTFNGDYGEKQILHMLDDVLNPYVADLNFIPTAYDFLSNIENWHISPLNVQSYLQRVQENKLAHLFKQSGSNTFFVPVDSGIDNYKYSMIDKYIVFGHIIQGVVLFTRPAKENFLFESMANGDFVYIVLNFLNVQDRIYVKSNTVLGDVTHQSGVIVAEIVKANIPVSNGVIHLISNPLAIADRVLKPFPYLPIMDKISTDPNLDFVYKVVSKSWSLEQTLRNTSLMMTFFVPRDWAWQKLEENNLQLLDRDTDAISKHLVVSDRAYSMGKLLALSRAHNYTDFPLSTLGGTINLTVLIMDDLFYIKYQNKYIKVHRPDYECSNGIIHIIDAPIGKVTKKMEERDTRKTPDVWKAIHRYFG